MIFHHCKIVQEIHLLSYDLEQLPLYNIRLLCLCLEEHLLSLFRKIFLFSGEFREGWLGGGLACGILMSMLWSDGVEVSTLITPYGGGENFFVLVPKTQKKSGRSLGSVGAWSLRKAKWVESEKNVVFF